MADPYTNPGPFPTPQAVLHWLKPRLPPDTVTLWGIKPGTKNVHNLFLELFQGQSTLSNSFPPLLSLHLILVNVVMNYGDDNKKFLRESQQLLSDGTMRPCSGLLTGKMKAGETVEAVVLRVTREQLGSVLGTRSTEEVIRIFPGSCNIEEV